VNKQITTAFVSPSPAILMKKEKRLALASSVLRPHSPRCSLRSPPPDLVRRELDLDDPKFRPQATISRTRYFRKSFDLAPSPSPRKFT